IQAGLKQCKMSFYSLNRRKFRHWWIYQMARGPLEQNGSIETRKMKKVLWLETRQAWLHMVTLKKRVMMKDEWENIRERVKVDEEVTQKLQTEERDMYGEVDQAKMLVDLIN
nr:hypothetical protein [Tanacetum cinerariifolium]